MCPTRTVLQGLTATSSLAAAGAGALIIAAFRRDVRTARARLSGQSRLVETARGLVEIAESGTGPPVLVMHGTGGGFDQGLLAARSLPDGYRIIAPSRFGYLRSPMPADGSHAEQAETLAALLDTLGVPRAVVLAVSAGAQPAIQLALRHPDRVHALVLITPALHLPPKPGAPPASGPPGLILDHVLASNFAVWALGHLAPNLLVRVAGVPRSLDDQLRPELREQLVDGFFPASARHVGLAHDICTTTPIAPDLPIEQLQMPVMLVGTADDRYHTGDVVRYSAGAAAHRDGAPPRVRRAHSDRPGRPDPAGDPGLPRRPYRGRRPPKPRSIREPVS